MILEDDAALNSYEWLDYLDSCEELDAPAGLRDKRMFIVILADHTHAVEVKLWELLTTRGADSILPP